MLSSAHTKPHTEVIVTMAKYLNYAPEHMGGGGCKHKDSKDPRHSSYLVEYQDKNTGQFDSQCAIITIV